MKMKILIAEDSATDRLIIGNMLKQHDVLTAVNGIEAMNILRNNKGIEIIVLDLFMPEMNGFEVLEAIRADESLSGIRTIVLTNSDELENELKALHLGAVDYIRKPINMESLKTRIAVHEELLRLHHLISDKLDEESLIFSSIFQQAPIGIAISYDDDPFSTGDTRYAAINPMYEKITGRTRDELTRVGWASITHPDDVGADLENNRRMQAGEIESYSMEKRYIKPDGSLVWVYMVVTALKNDVSKKYNHICLIQDISQRKAAEADLAESERSKSVLLSHLPGMAYRCKLDRNWSMEFVSAGCLGLTGYGPEALVGNRDLAFNDIIAPEYRDMLWDYWQKAISSEADFRNEYEIITASGERKWVLEVGQGIFGAGGKVEALEGIILDISDRKEMENKLIFNYEHDRWTRLHNRVYLETLLNRDHKKALAGDRALISINLSQVQSLTPVYGFHYTQDVILTVTDSLRSLCSDNRELFNTYENRFAFYVRKYTDTDELVGFCHEIGSMIKAVLAGERIGAGISVLEIGNYPEAGADQLLTYLLIASEKAMADQVNEVSICFYDSRLEAEVKRGQDIKRELTEIADSIEDDRLYLQFQPIYDLKTRKICEFEALARFRSDKFGPVSPVEFIPLAESSKLIIPLGEIVIRQALVFLDKLRESGFDEIRISVNISAIQLLRVGFIDSLFRIIEETGAEADRLIIEITESVFASNYMEVNRILKELQNKGIEIAIDDFGTGYSSLARERELNVNCLKIDKYFIDKLMVLDPVEAITGDIISMAHRLGHYVVAEGVEYDKQLNYLISRDCDKIQGFLISKPVDADEAIKLLSSL